MSDVLLGAGLATGMFYHAPAGTALPTTPADTLATAWEEVGDVTDAGIVLGLSKSAQNLKNWANKIKRVIYTDHAETVQSPIMDTTEETLKTVVGDDNVTVTAASSAHGKLLTVNLSAGDPPEAEAFLWIMKDGDNMMALGTTKGQITGVENVTMAPNGAITWTPTVTAIDDMKLIIDDGQKTT